MGCGQSAPALLVPQPRGAAAPILPTTDVAYSDGVTELTVGYTDAAWWKNQEIRVRKQKELDESGCMPGPACRSQPEELVLEFKTAAGKLFVKEERDGFPQDTKWSNVIWRDGSGKIVALLSEGEGANSVALKAYAYQNRKGKGLLYAPTGEGQSPPAGHSTKTVEGVPMHVVGEVRGAYDTCTLHKAAAGGGFDGAAALKMLSSGAIRNGAKEAVASMERPQILTVAQASYGALSLKVVENVDVALVLALISTWVANNGLCAFALVVGARG